jgi:hypothetical protein
MGNDENLECAANSDSVASFEQRLEEFSQGLDERERHMLHAILYCAADPLDRIAMRGDEDVFSAEEEALLAGMK